MDSVAQIRIAYALKKQAIKVEVIAEEVGRERATVFRWFKGIRQWGIEGYIRHYRTAKKGRWIRKTHSYIEQRVLSIRREYRNCCGQKVKYLLAQEGIRLSISTIYRILRKHLTLLHKHARTTRGVPAQRGKRAGDVLQMDTIDLGEVYGFTAIDTFSRQAAVVIRPGLTAQDGQAALHLTTHATWSPLYLPEH